MALDLDPEYPELLATIAEVVFAGLVSEAGVAEAASARIALDMAEAVRKRIGGTMLYLPMGARWELSHRDRQIVAALQRRPGHYQAVAVEFGLSEMRVRQIEARWLATERAKRQAGLFPAGDDDDSGA